MGSIEAGVEACLRPESGPPPKRIPGIVGVGLDVGQRRDPSALCVAEVAEVDKEVYFLIRHAEALPLGTPYTGAAERVAEVCEGVAEKLIAEWVKRHDVAYMQYTAWDCDVGTPRPMLPAPPLIHLRIDSTGLGAPVTELVRDALSPRVKNILDLTPCYFTHGDRLSRSDGGGLSVGKAYLVSRLQALMQSGRIKFPRGLAVGGQLVQELLDYELSVSEDANAKYGAFRVGSHDDLVTALGLAILKEPSRSVPLVGGL